MLIINLDKNFTPFGENNTIEYQSLTFTGGEPHIKIKDFEKNQKVMITHRVNSFNDFGLLILTIDALRRMDIKEIEVFIPYFPAARQDRVMIPGEPLSVKVYADILNSYNLSKVYVFDAHSEVTPAVLNNCEVITNFSFIENVYKQLNDDLLLVSPDGGALKKIYKVSEYLGGKEVIECSKRRDVKTGKIKSFKVYEDDLKGKNCLIVDDICDGGQTFIGLAQELKLKNAGKIFLAVSHGIFSKGFENLVVFDKIFTTNSFRDIEDKNVEVVKIDLK